LLIIVRRMIPHEKTLSSSGGGIVRAPEKFHKKCLINGISQTMIPCCLSGMKGISVEKNHQRGGS
jgi:hypothetical protein